MKPGAHAIEHRGEVAPRFRKRKPVRGRRCPVGWTGEIDIQTAEFLFIGKARLRIQGADMLLMPGDMKA